MDLEGLTYEGQENEGDGGGQSSRNEGAKKKNGSEIKMSKKVT